MSLKKKHPYADLPDHAFWRQAVSRVAWNALDPVIEDRPIIDRQSAVASAGSCFAQHVARYIQKAGYRYLVTEKREGAETALFSACYGNIYTARQMLQLAKRAYGLMNDGGDKNFWRGPKNGLWLDALRPEAAGPWTALESAARDRLKHLACVRRIFEEADIFVFTLGLTECWAAKADGLVYPAAPGVLAEADLEDFEFLNFTVADVVADFLDFLAIMRTKNPEVKIILTVSPVPLRATASGQHVLVANSYSKSVLRAAAEEIRRSAEGIYYFPSYEIFTGSYNGGRFYQSDLREVTAAGVDLAMRLFLRHFTVGGRENDNNYYEAADYDDVVCEPALDNSTL